MHESLIPHLKWETNDKYWKMVACRFKLSFSWFLSSDCSSDICSQWDPILAEAVRPCLIPLELLDHITSSLFPVDPGLPWWRSLLLHKRKSASLQTFGFDRQRSTNASEVLRWEPNQLCVLLQAESRGWSMRRTWHRLCGYAYLMLYIYWPKTI